MKLNEEMQKKVEENLGLIRSKILWRLFSFGGKHEVIT